jgi:hypothetical protein
MNVNVNQPVAYTWLFGSKSNPKAVPHETRQYYDGTVSCNCPGWTRKVQPDGSRTCRHTRLVETGHADEFCVDKIDHTAGKAAPTPIKAKKAPAPVKKEEEIVVEAPKKAPNVARMIKW